MATPEYMKWLPARTIERLGRLEFLARGTMDGFVSGRHRSARKGASVEFAQHREYAPGDDLRNLDWRLIARRQRCYVREYVDERIREAIDDMRVSEVERQAIYETTYRSLVG